MRSRSTLLVAALLAASALAPVASAGGAPAAATPRLPSVRMVENDVLAFGDARWHGGTTSYANAPIVGIARAPHSDGYWETTLDGAIFSFVHDRLNRDRFYGSMANRHLNQPIVGIAATPSGRGYWLVASDGGIFTFGDARYYGSTGAMHLNRPIVGMAPTPSGKGYWLVASDGGIFTFGDARFFGSMGGTPLNQPVVGISATSNGNGYWLVATDGGVFTFGNARFHGPNFRGHLPVVGIATRPGGGGYWLVDVAGHVFAFGNARSFGNAADAVITRPIVGITATASGNGYWIVGRGTQPVYFLRGGQLGAATRDVRSTYSTALVDDLLAGPNAAERAAGMTSAIPAGTQGSVFHFAGSTAEVTLSPSFGSAASTESMRARIAQVVLTLTGIPGIDHVEFFIDFHRVTTIGGVPVVPLPTHAMYEDFLPQVSVITPTPGDLVTSPLVITGEINSFEGVGTFELTASDGRPLAFGIGQGAMGFWRPFATVLPFSPSSSRSGTIVARPTSGIEGTPRPDAVIPVRFR